MLTVCTNALADIHAVCPVTRCNSITTRALRRVKEIKQSAGIDGSLMVSTLSDDAQKWLPNPDPYKHSLIFWTLLIVMLFPKVVSKIISTCFKSQSLSGMAPHSHLEWRVCAFFPSASTCRSVLGKDIEREIAAESFSQQHMNVNDGKCSAHPLPWVWVCAVIDEGDM